MPEEIRRKIEITPKYEFFKVKKIVEFVSSQFGNNLNYSRKRQLTKTVQYLVYS